MQTVDHEMTVWPSPSELRPSVDGKFFRVDGRRFPVRGVTYGTFSDGELGLFPSLEQTKRDFATMSEAGVNTVRTYTLPDERVLDLADGYELRLLVGVWWEDARYLARPTPAAWKEMARHARSAVREAVSWAPHQAVLGFVVGNELPGPVVRWHGRRRVEDLLRSLYEAGKEVAPEALLSYANYPTTGYLDTSYFDFACFNVFLENEVAFRRYLAQLQVETGDQPLVLTEMGLDARANGEQRQAEMLDWQLGAVLEHGLAGACVFSWTDEWWVGGTRVEGWEFGLTRADRSPKPALEIMARRYAGGLPACRESWPSVTVVVCAYQEEVNIEDCLRSLLELDYPDYEIVVVDDGSTDATAPLARRYPVTVISEGRRGLSGARNLGIEHATGEIVAYIDADAQADPDWLTYLVLVMDRRDAAGAGGPNIVPSADPPAAQCIARAPGGPVHVLIDNERAEHIPGCNMAFRRHRLIEVGGFDPVYRAAGDDVDICWKLLDAGHTIGFAPSAVVWHHPRRTVRAFWRQQVGYGRAEALVAGAHPEKFNSVGQAMWRGVIYGPSSILPTRSFLYAGKFGEAPYQRLYHEPIALRTLSLLYGVGGLLVLTLFDPHLLPLVLAAAAGLVGLSLAQGLRIARRDALPAPLRQGSLIGLLHLVQPVARLVGRLRSWRLAYPPAGASQGRLPALRLFGRGRYLATGVSSSQRSAFLEQLRDRLRAGHLRATVAPGWESADLVCDSPLFFRLRLVSYVEWDTIYLRVTRRLRPPRSTVAFATVVLLAGGWSLTLALEAAAALVGLLLVDALILHRRVRRACERHP